MILLGNDVLVAEVGGEVFAASKSCTLDVKCDTIEIANAGNGGWRDFIAGKSEWSLTLNFLMMTDDLPKVLNVGNSYDLWIYPREAGGESGSDLNTLTGTALCTEARCVATRGNLTTGSFKFVGQGILS